MLVAARLGLQSLLEIFWEAWPYFMYTNTLLFFFFPVIYESEYNMLYKSDCARV